MAESDSGFLSTPDLVLSFIPGLLLAAMVAVGVFGVSTYVALAAGSVPAAGAVGYALFWEPPTDGAE